MSSGAISPARAPASIDMLQTVMRPSIDSARIAEPRYSMTEPMPAAGADLGDDREHDVLRGDAGRQVAFDRDRHRARPLLGERLGREHVLDLARADAERERAERAVRRRVAVAAHDRHARLGQPLLGADDVHDALERVAHAVEPDAELLAVRGERLDLLARDRVGDAELEADGRHVVVHRRDGQLGPAHAAPVQAQPVEGLRRRDLVHEVEVDVEEVGLAVAAVDDVLLPHLLAQRLGHGPLLVVAWCSSQYLR